MTDDVPVFDPTWHSDDEPWIPPTHVRRNPEGRLIYGNPGYPEAGGWRELDGYERRLLLASWGVLDAMGDEWTDDMTPPAEGEDE